jgi:hypothetical protein
LIQFCIQCFRWLLYIDVDEFVFPLKENSLIPFLKEYEDSNVGYVTIQNMIFDQVTDSNCSLVIGKYFRRASKCQYKERQKFACKVEHCNVPTVHAPEMVMNYIDLSSKEIRINHYFNAHHKENRNLPMPIEIFDDSMKRFMDPLMEKLNISQYECPLSKFN